MPKLVGVVVDPTGTVAVEPLTGLRLEGKAAWRTEPYEEYDVRVTISIPGLQAVAEFPWWNVGWLSVAAFFREIDRDWRGWQGAKEYGSTDGPIHLSALHDGLGHIRLSVGLADALVGDNAHYRLMATLGFDVGNAGVVANLFGDWVAAIWDADSPMQPTEPGGAG